MVLLEEFIEERFNENYELLRATSGRGLSAEVRAGALKEVLVYLQKMYHVAATVTDTEVRLALPQQTSPGGREFTIEGVVDIVRERGFVVMYDIKTHNVEDVRANIEGYREQLNVYAHIWNHVREEPLRAAAVIALKLPAGLRKALDEGNPDFIQYQLDQWAPLVDVPLSKTAVEETMEKFGAVVDLIEEGAFQPPEVERLTEKEEGLSTSFGNRICGNCDARFSCESYHTYQSRFGRRTKERFHQFFLDDEADGVDRDQRRSARIASTNLDSQELIE